MADNLLQQVAENLRVLRRQRGMTREQLAGTAGIEAQMLKRIEHARANPALVVLSRIAGALAISLSMMLTSDVTAEVTTAAGSSTASEPFDSESVGDTLVALRRSRGMSRRALASQAKMRPVTLSRYESATTDARLLGVEPIATALGVETAALVRAIELRQRESGQRRSGWHELSAGVRRRLVSSTGRTRLWEWRIDPAVAYECERPIDVSEEIVTAIRGEVRVENGGAMHRLRRGGSAPLGEGSRRLANPSRSTARLLWFQVQK